MLETTWVRWVIGVVAGLAIVALLAWARNDPGVDDRDPDPPQTTEVVSDEGSLPPQGTTVDTDGDTVTPTT